MSFFTRMGTDSVPYTLTITTITLNLSDTVTAKQHKNSQLAVCVQRGDHKQVTDAVLGSGGLYEYTNKKLTLTATLYRKKNKFLSKQCDIHVQCKGKTLGTTSIDLINYVDTSKPVSKNVKVSVGTLGATISLALHTVPSHEAEAQSEENSVSDRLAASSKPAAASSKKAAAVVDADDDSSDGESDTEAAIDRFRKKPSVAAAAVASAPAAKPAKKRVDTSSDDSSDGSSDDSDDDVKPAAVSKKAVQAASESKRALQNSTNTVNAAPVRQTSTGKSPAKPPVPASSSDDSDDSSDDDKPVTKPAVKPVSTKTAPAVSQPNKPSLKKPAVADSDDSDDEPDSRHVKFGANQTKTIAKQNSKDSSDDSSDDDTPAKPPAAKTSAAATPTPAPATSKSNRIVSFNATLAEMYASQQPFKVPGDIPVVASTLLQCIRMLNGTRAEGIFRISASTAQRDTLVKQLSSGNFKVTAKDVLLLASVLKYWFGALTDAVLPAAVYEQCISIGKRLCSDSDDSDDSDAEPDLTGGTDKLLPTNTAGIKTALYNVYSTLPILNKHTLQQTIQLLQQISAPDNVSQSKMTVTNLATVFAPNWLRSGDKSGKKPAVQFAEAKYAVKFVECIIEHADVLDASIAGKPIAAALPAKPAAPAAAPTKPAGKASAPKVVDSDDSDDEHESALPTAKAVDSKASAATKTTAAPIVSDSDDSDDEPAKPAVSAKTAPAAQSKATTSAKTPVIDSDDSSDDEPAPARQHVRPAPAAATSKQAPAAVKKPAVTDSDSDSDSDDDAARSTGNGKAVPAVVITPPSQPAPAPAKPATANGKAAPVIQDSSDDSDDEPAPQSQRRGSVTQQKPPAAKAGAALINAVRVLPTPTNNDQQYKDKISELESTIAELKATNEKLKSVPLPKPVPPPPAPPAASANKQILALNEKIDVLTDENVKLNERLARATAELKSVVDGQVEQKRENKQLTAQNTELSEQVRQLTSDLKMTQQKSSKKADAAVVDTGSDRLLSKMRLQVVELTDKCMYNTDLAQSYKAVIDTLNGEVVALNTAAKHTEYLNSDVVGKMLKKEKNVKLSDAYTALKAMYDAQSSQLSDLQEVYLHSKTGWQNVNAVLQNQVDTCESKIAAMDKQISDMLAGMSGDMQKYVVLQQLNDKLSVLNKKYKSKVETLEQTVADNKITVEQQTAEVKQLTTDLELVKAELIKSGISLQALANDNFEMKEYLRINTKGK